MPPSHDIPSFKEAQQILKSHLDKASQHTFTSTSSAGALPLNATSDHLPIEARDEDGNIVAVSANLLSDQHLYNMFIPLANIGAIKQELKDAGLGDNSYIDKLHMFFYEMAEYSRLSYGLNHTTQSFSYNDKNFQQFLNSDFFFKTREPQKAKADRQKIGEWIQSLPDKSIDGGLSKQDIALSMAHAFQLLHHIEYGGLNHDENVENSRSNLFLKSGMIDTFQKTLKEAGFVNLQECTNPKFILDQLVATGGNYKAIIHNSSKDGNSEDNCVLLYNADTFKVPKEDQIQKFTLGSKSPKPAIIASFERIADGNPIIVGSIHHPGGDHENEIDTILAKTQRLIGNNLNTKIIITGDFNHNKEFVSTALNRSDLKVFSSAEGTMSGPDFAKSVQDQAIDLAISNIPLQINRLVFKTRPVPSITAEIPITVSLGAAQATLARASHFHKPFTQRVLESRERSNQAEQQRN